MVDPSKLRLRDYPEATEQERKEKNERQSHTTLPTSTAVEGHQG